MHVRLVVQSLCIRESSTVKSSSSRLNGNTYNFGIGLAEKRPFQNHTKIVGGWPRPQPCGPAIVPRRERRFSRSPPEKSATPPRRNVRALAWAAGWRVAALRMLRIFRGEGGRAAAGAGARAFRSCQGCRMLSPRAIFDWLNFLRIGKDRCFLKVQRAEVVRGWYDVLSRLFSDRLNDSP